MITFLPSRTFTVCAKSLDPQRLVQQVSEARHILEAILAGEKVGQPAYDMWRKYPGHLAIYGKIMADEHHIRFGTPRSEQRFFIQHIPAWFMEIAISMQVRELHADPQQIGWDARRDPPWLGDRRLHFSHVRRLYEKDPTWYSKWRQITIMPAEYCCVGCNYWWPSHAGVV